MSTPLDLTEVRTRIDELDCEVVRLLARRQELVRTAAGFKSDEQAVRAPDRVERVIAAVRDRAVTAGLAPEVAEAVWRAMIAAFIDLELHEHRRNTEVAAADPVPPPGS
ncbi:chorismate mutase [Embleya sp. NPDC001921]